MVRSGLPQPQVLNPDGHLNVPADGHPAFAWNALDQTYEVVWSRHDGTDFEIVHSLWAGTEWTTIAPLTANSLDDRDPVIAFAPDGTARVVYHDGLQVWMLTRPASGSWSGPELIDLGELASTASTLLERAVYQREGTGGLTEIVAAYHDGTWSPTVLATTAFAGLDGTGSVDARIGAAAGAIWIAWEHDATTLAWVELVGGSWSPIQYEPIAGASDEEAGRIRIKTAALD